MPRTGKGGARAGAVGTAYAERSDLNGAPAPEPVAAAPGQPYGEASAQKAAQRAIPISAPATGVTPTGGAGGGAAPVSSLSQGQAPPGPLPGELLFDHPTMRPNEPITAGLDRGPGPGSEANIGVGSAGQVHQQVGDLLNALTKVPGATPDVMALASYANSGRG